MSCKYIGPRREFIEAAAARPAPVPSPVTAVPPPAPPTAATPTRAPPIDEAATLREQLQQERQQVAAVRAELSQTQRQLQQEAQARQQAEQRATAAQSQLQTTEQALRQAEQRAKEIAQSQRQATEQEKQRADRLQKDLEALRSQLLEAHTQIAVLQSNPPQQQHPQPAPGLPVASEEQLFIEKAKASFHASLTNVYPGLYYCVTGITRAQPSEEFQGRHQAATALILARDDLDPREKHRRIVYHTARHPEAVAAITRDGMRPSRCPLCTPGLDRCGDPGWFGDHTKGVYVSKHADYTTFYQNDREPRQQDTGRIIAFELIQGKTKYMPHREPGCNPTPGYHCHESPNHLEYFVFDPALLLPLFVVDWVAVKSRCNIPHDQ